MKKIILFFILLTIPLALALEECDSPIEPSDIPCQIISTYNFDDACSSTQLRFYFENASLIGSTVWDDYGATGLCNATFNFTTRGSYTLNSTDGSFGTIIVRGVKMEFLKLGIFGLLFILGMILIAFMHHFKEDEGSSIAYGFFALAVFSLLGALTMFGFDPISIDGLDLPFNINKSIGLICFILGIYSAWFSGSLLQFKRAQQAQIKAKQEWEVR